jgi:hypothetical protein
MMSRIRTPSVLEMLKLTRPTEKKGVWEGVWDTIIAAIKKNGNSESINEWKRVDCELSHWEIVLLEWAASTGEMRNHEACHSHEDGNNSHFLETVWFGGKVDLKDQSSSTTKAKGMTSGKLVLPIQGVTLDVRCGSDLLHLSLKNTMHAADETRNRLNFSRVHGPQLANSSSTNSTQSEDLLAFSQTGPKMRICHWLTNYF